MPGEGRLPPLYDLLRADALSGRHLWAAGASVALEALARGTSLGGALPALHGRSVLVAMEHQLATVLALIELDGIARDEADITHGGR